MSRKRADRLRRMRQAARKGHDPSVVSPVRSALYPARALVKRVEKGEVKFHPPRQGSRVGTRELEDRQDGLWQTDIAKVRKEFGR